MPAKPSEFPADRDRFAAEIARLLRGLRPSFAVEAVDGRELLVNGRRFDLDNLHRMVAPTPDKWQAVATQFLEQMFSEESMRAADLPLEFVRPRVMPRIQPVSIFERLSAEQVAHVPFVNDTVIVFVTDLPTMTVSITTEQIIRWGVSVDELDELARANLERYAARLEVQVVESKEGGKAIVLGEHDGYDAARLLISSLFNKLAPELGGDFLVATPARDMFVAMTQGPNGFLDRLRDRVRQDYKRLPYPITDELFYVTRDGIAGTKAA